MFWITVGHASRHTARAIGPSTIERSNLDVVWMAQIVHDGDRVASGEWRVASEDWGPILGAIVHAQRRQSSISTRRSV
jgi:hypothetical protein